MVPQSTHMNENWMDVQAAQTIWSIIQESFVKNSSWTISKCFYCIQSN